MNILAIDLGKFNSMFCFFDSTSQSAEFLQAATSRSYFRSVLANRSVDLVVMEACGPSGWVKDLCEELTIATLVCSTNEEAWRWKNVKRKTDRDDALKLARLAVMNQLKPTHVPSQAMREYRTLVKYRKTIVRRINRIKNSIRSLFANRGIEISRGAKTWHTGRTFLYEQRKPLAAPQDRLMSRDLRGLRCIAELGCGWQRESSSRRPALGLCVPNLAGRRKAAFH
jgi:transposase